MLSQVWLKTSKFQKSCNSYWLINVRKENKIFSHSLSALTHLNSSLRLPVKKFSVGEAPYYILELWKTFFNQSSKYFRLILLKILPAKSLARKIMRCKLILGAGYVRFIKIYPVNIFAIHYVLAEGNKRKLNVASKQEVGESHDCLRYEGTRYIKEDLFRSLLRSNLLVNGAESRRKNFRWNIFTDQKWFNNNLNREWSAAKLILKAIMKTASTILTGCRSTAALRQTKLSSSLTWGYYRETMLVRLILRNWMIGSTVSSILTECPIVVPIEKKLCKYLQ